MSLIGVVKEQPGESRVAATPETVKVIISLGYQVVVEKGAGAKAAFPDSAYAEAGAKIASTADAWKADTVLSVTAPTPANIKRLKKGAIFVGVLSPALKPQLLEALAKQGVTALAMDAVPRISRAQSMDVLSSMANIAGYRAVIEAAHEFGRFFTGQVTAAGKVSPAKVLVAGAGVAGLAAIGSASSLGAIVRATDPRPEVADQVKSIGGEYLAVEVEEKMQSSDGYAKETSKAYELRAAQIYTEQAADVDIIITTALIPGRPAPKLITAKDVSLMKPGSVIVDMAAAQGGNVAGSVAGERVVTKNGVIILGYTDLPSRLPAQSSQLYGTNLVQRAVTVVKAGKITWPPPPVQVSAAPPAKAEEPVAMPEKKKMSGRTRGALTAVGMAGLFGLVSLAPAPLPQHFLVLMLSVVIGFYVIGKVHHALHTPLMSVTNAISGIVVVAAILQITDSILAVQILAAIGVLLASINVFGGFAVTRRMLKMFTRGDQ